MTMFGNGYQARPGQGISAELSIRIATLEKFIFDETALEAIDRLKGADTNRTFGTYKTFSQLASEEAEKIKEKIANGQFQRECAALLGTSIFRYVMADGRTVFHCKRCALPLDFNEQGKFQASAHLSDKQLIAIAKIPLEDRCDHKPSKPVGKSEQRFVYRP